MVAAVTGVMPRPGDLVNITNRAGIGFANAPIPNFQVIQSELLVGWPGWCRIRGYDADQTSDPTGDDIVWHRVRVAALTIRPGDGWPSG